MQTRRFLTAPSLLSADFSAAGRAAEQIEQAGGDLIHLDVMDGSFVPPITFGDQMVRQLRPVTKLPLDVHLMVERPESKIRDFAEAGADWITFHLEAATHPHRLIQQIHDLGKKAGIALVPSTPAESLSELFGDLDLILVMSVNPGYGAQKLIPRTLQKIRKLAQMRTESNSRYQISVDGGINAETAGQAKQSGADILVTGSAFFRADDPAAYLRSIASPE